METELRDHIQRICLEHRFYGYRRVKRELTRIGLDVNDKKVRRMMAEDNLLAVRKRAWIQTTDSRHDLAVFGNLAQVTSPKGPDQMWVADLTYIRLRGQFVYLAVVLDAWSRRVVGWALGRDLSASLPRQALVRAIEQRRPAPGLVHHSDRGVQYTSCAYLTVLQEYRIVGSMSRAANPWDNARCESFLKTLKREQIYCHRFSSLEELESGVEWFIEEYYNKRRLHSALNYRSPAEIEAVWVA